MDSLLLLLLTSPVSPRQAPGASRCREGTPGLQGGHGDSSLWTRRSSWLERGAHGKGTGRRSPVISYRGQRHLCSCSTSLVPGVSRRVSVRGQSLKKQKVSFVGGRT